MWLRKPSSSSTSSGLSSCSSSEVSSHRSRFQSDSGMDLSSIAEQVFEDLSISETNTSDTDTAEIISSRRHSNSGVNLTLNFSVSSPEDESLYELYKQFLDWLDPKSKIFSTVTGKPSRHTQDKFSSSYIPSLAVVMFLHDEEQAGHFQKAHQYFTSRPWKFHHQEWASGQMQVYPNSHHYYMLTMDRPLCSVRQIHCGKQYVRILRYVSSKHWKDTISFYKLILHRDTVALKRDFCVFTIGQFPNYDFQFAMKRLPKNMVPKRTRKAQLCFQVCDIGSLVPLFPNECHKVSDTKWCTKDLDGNKIYLEVPKLPRRCRSVSPSKFYAHSKHSAFSPVVPNRGKPNEKPDNLLDKLSPRVYTPKDGSTVKGRPPLPNKVSSVSKSSNKTLHHCTKNITRIRPASANSISTESVTNVRACPQASTPIKSVTNLRTRPSSANSVLISNNIDTVCSHSYTDSGFVDSSMDSSFARDPRRTPIIGISNLTQYERFISTPTGELSISQNSYGEVPSSSSFDDILSPASTEESFSFVPNNDNVFVVERDLHHQVSDIAKPCSVHQGFASHTSKSWVECYVEDQNKLLREQSPIHSHDLQNMVNNYYDNRHVNNNVTENSKWQKDISRNNYNDKSQVIYANEHKPFINEDQSLNENFKEMGIDCEQADKVTDQVVPSVQSTENTNFIFNNNASQEPVSLDSKQNDVTGSKEDNEANPRCVAVDVENHDLQEYMHLCWANSGNRSHQPVSKNVSSNSDVNMNTANLSQNDTSLDCTTSIEKIVSDSQASPKKDSECNAEPDFLYVNKEKENSHDINYPHEQEQSTSDLTLAEYLTTNKTVIDFLERRGNGSQDIQLPDVVQSNDCDSNQVPTIMDNSDSGSNNHNREGCPDDVPNTNRLIKSCLQSEVKTSRKRVTFSEVNNSRHEYEGMDWSQDIINADCDTETNQDSDFDDAERMQSNQVVYSPANRYPVDISTTANVSVQNTNNVSSIIAKFNNPEPKQVETLSINNVNTKPPTNQDKHFIYSERSVDVTEAVNSQKSSLHQYSRTDWDKIKQRPEVGFYI